MSRFKFSSRWIEIIKFLAPKDDFVSSKALATALKVSVRTIYRELEKMDALLNEYDMQLINKKGHGFKIEGAVDAFLEEVHSETDNRLFSFLGVQERRELLFIRCLELKEPTKLKVLSDYFDVSESTIARDLDVLEDKFEKNNLQLIRKTGYGVQVLGDVSDVTRLRLDYIRNKLNYDSFVGIDKNKQSMDIDALIDNISADVMFLLDQDILKKVVRICLNKELSVLHGISHSAFLGFLIHLTLTVQRIKLNEVFNIPDRYITSILPQEMSGESIRISQLIEFYFNVEVPEGEKIYISMLINNLNRSDSKSFDITNEVHVYTMVLIDLFGMLTSLDFSNDTMLYEGLSSHFNLTLERLSYGLSVRNPLLDQIKQEYSEFFNIMKKACGVIGFLLKIKIDDDESAYILLHFLAAIERKKQEDMTEKSIVVGMIYAQGLGLSLLVTSTLKNRIENIKKIHSISKEQLKQKDYSNDIDLFISTEALDIDNVPFVVVSPIITEEDIKRINDLTSKIDETKRKEKSTYEDYTESLNINYSLLDNIQLKIVDQQYNKESLIKSLLDSPELSDEEKRKSYDAIVLRESLGSVQLNDEFVFYHGVVEKLNKSQILFFSIDEKVRDAHDYKAGTLLLLSESQETYDRHTLSLVSLCLLENPDLIEEVISPNPKIDTIKKIIVTYIKTV